MTAGKRRLIETLRDRINTSERISDDDRDALMAFSQHLDLLGPAVYSDHRHEKLLRHCTRIAEEVGGLAEALENREAAEAIVRWIQRNYENPETNRDYRLAVRAFGKHALKQAEPPESIAWIPASTPKSYDPMPSRGDMLDWEEDVLPMIERGARNARDRALFAIQYEGGFRSGELYAMTVGDVIDDENGIYIRANGKTGEREVQLMGNAVAYLTDWLEKSHPAPTDPTAPIWCQLDVPEMASEQTFLKYFKRAAKRAGVTKPVTPTNFRKSNAYYLANIGANAALIEDRQGRRRGSKAVARYIGRFGKDAEAQYRGLFGIAEDGDIPNDPRPHECPRCGKTTPRHRERCMNCRLPFDPLKAYEEGRGSREEVSGSAVLRHLEDTGVLEELAAQVRAQQ